MLPTFMVRSVRSAVYRLLCHKSWMPRRQPQKVGPTSVSTVSNVAAVVASLFGHLEQAAGYEARIGRLAGVLVSDTARYVRDTYPTNFGIKKR
jgi:hypothetical protein